MKRRTLALAAFSACLFGHTATAYAINTPSPWNSTKTPLTVKGYGSTGRAAGSIRIAHTTDGNRLINSASHTFDDADDHSFYLDGHVQFNAGTCGSGGTTVVRNGVEVNNSTSCAQQFYDHEEFRTNGLNYTVVNRWVALPYSAWGVNPGADRGRITVRAQIDVPWRSDPESGLAISANDTF